MLRPIILNFRLGLLALLFVGCAQPRTVEPEIDPQTLDDSAFQLYINQVPLVTVDEAYRAMLILADGKDSSASFEERQQTLESRGIARSAWDLQRDDVIDSGSVAFMVCRICEIPGGINQMMLGSWGLGDRRYALRELMFRKMIDDTVDYQYMRGSTLFALMRNADALMEEKGLYESSGINLSDETDRDASGELIVPNAPSSKNDDGQ